MPHSLQFPLFRPKSCSAIVASLLLVSAVPTQAAETQYLYSGAQYNFETIDNGPSNHQQSIGLTVGYQFHANWALEGRFNWGTKGQEHTITDPLTKQSYPYKEKLKNQSQLYLKGSYPLNEQLSLYGLAGFTYSKFDADTLMHSVDSNGKPTPATPITLQFSNNGLSYGVGASWQYNSQLAVNLDYQVLPDVDFVSVQFATSALTLGVKFNY